MSVLSAAFSVQYCSCISHCAVITLCCFAQLNLSAVFYFHFLFCVHKCLDSSFALSLSICPFFFVNFNMLSFSIPPFYFCIFLCFLFSSFFSLHFVFLCLYCLFYFLLFSSLSFHHFVVCFSLTMLFLFLFSVFIFCLHISTSFSSVPYIILYSSLLIVSFYFSRFKSDRKRWLERWPASVSMKKRMCITKRFSHVALNIM